MTVWLFRSVAHVVLPKFSFSPAPKTATVMLGVNAMSLPVRPVFYFYVYRLFTVISSIGGGEKSFTVMSNTRGVKERGDAGEKRLIKASCFLKVFVWIITVLFKVAGVAIIRLS